MSHYQTVSIDNLQTGMFVEAVAKQTGKLKIKSQGKIKSESVIAWLKNQGILEVIVDTSKYQNLSKRVVANDDNRIASNNPVKEPVSLIEPTQYVDFKLEIKRAIEIHKNARHIQKRLFNAVEKDLEFNLNATQQVVSAVIASLSRNPNALLFLTQIRSKGGYLFEHSANCGILMAAFATSMGLERRLVSDLAMAGLLHDLGMIKIPSKIINNAGKLDSFQKKQVQQHVKYSDALLVSFDELNEPTIKAIRAHHERLDGSGYPLGLEGKQVNLYGRMLAIVDSYDAMISERKYKSPILAANALKLLLKYSETQYDRELVCKFIKCIGVYPIGSLVKLKSEKIAVVTGINDNKPFRPKVSTFYSTRSNHFLAKRDVDLGVSRANEQIVGPTSAKANRIDYARFFVEQMQPT